MSIRAKKSLGQHFLRSKTALTQIIDAAKLSSADLVLEIGPGEGALTEALIASGARVIAVETDTRCIASLPERFHEQIKNGQLTLIEGDIRNDDIIAKLFEKDFLGKNSYKLIANIPYYITGMLFRLFLEKLRQPTDIVFLIQKEVAEEIISRDSKEGILSLSVKAFGTPRYVAKVKREAFTPAPKVDSAIIHIGDINRNRLPAKDNDNYFRIVKAGLGSRRKMLLGNLIRAFPEKRTQIEETFTKLSIDTTIRGEDLPSEKWLALTRQVSIK